MDLPGFLEAIKSYGLPLILLLAALWFFNAKIWPLVTGSIANSERRADEVLKAGQEQWVIAVNGFEAAQKQEVQVLDRMVKELEGMRGDIRRRNKDQ